MVNNDRIANLPTFLFIGTGKAGSTSLYYYLREHPEVFMSPVKETNFFSYEGGRPNFAGPGDLQSMAHKTTIASIEAYQKNFQGVTNEKAIGEVSPSYLYVPQAPQRIKKYLPDVKMIAILRNPVDRAYSNYQHRLNLGLDPLTDFSEVINAEKSRIDSNWAPTWHYLAQGFYYQQLSRYFDLFEREQLRIYLFEDWSTNKLKLIQDIFDFIGVDATYTPNLTTKYNISGKPKSSIINNFLTKQSSVKTILKKVVPKQVHQRLGSELMMANLKRLPSLSSEVRQQLNQMYKPDILKLQDLIDRDLSNWLK